MRAIGEIARIELPPLGGIVEPRLEPVLLLLLRYVQVELEKGDVVLGEVPLETVDLLVALPRCGRTPLLPRAAGAGRRWPPPRHGRGWRKPSARRRPSADRGSAAGRG